MFSIAQKKPGFRLLLMDRRHCGGKKSITALAESAMAPAPIMFAHESTMAWMPSMVTKPTRTQMGWDARSKHAWRRKTANIASLTRFMMSAATLTTGRCLTSAPEPDLPCSQVHIWGRLLSSIQSAGLSGQPQLTRLFSTPADRLSARDRQVATLDHRSHPARLRTAMATIHGQPFGPTPRARSKNPTTMHTAG